MYKTFTMELGGREFSVQVGRVAELANGACIINYGETVVLCTATASEKPREGMDFFPLSVNYEERLYSVGKIPGGFIKREGRPSENAVLTSRLIDRPIRPLFPEDYRNDVAVIATVLSVDQDASPEIGAMIGSSIALAISDIPFGEPISGLNIGLINDKFIINPNSEERKISEMELVVSSTKNKIMMIEAGANEISEEKMFEAIKFAHNENKKVVEFIETIVAEVGVSKNNNYEKDLIDKSLYEDVIKFITDSKMEDAILTELKQSREEKMNSLTNEVVEYFTQNIEKDEMGKLTSNLKDYIKEFEKATIRKMILKDGKRPDHRKLDEIRELGSEIDILPRTHGSALFNRGQTQVLTVTTLGSIAEAQRLDGIDINEDTKRYMHHYNFPSFSVGETRPSRGPGRREIGHGALAERALLPVIPSEDDFPYAIRLVSEVLSSNGSTSQASVCASTLSLMAAGVPIKRPVAGISVGLVTGDTDDDYVLLSDIQGIEDFFGDMDFKVAGTEKGITAIQLDIKVNGITEDIIYNAIMDTKRTRSIILTESMNKAISEPRKEISKYAPKIIFLEIPADKMAEVIGPRGKVIKRIMEETGVDKIDTEDDGRIFVSDSDIEKANRAVEMIRAIVEPPVVGKIYKGTVTRILNFGAFVEIAPEKEGLVHISQIAKERIKAVEDVLSVGDVIDVKVLEIDEQNRINLSRKATLE